MGAPRFHLLSHFRVLFRVAATISTEQQPLKNRYFFLDQHIADHDNNNNSNMNGCSNVVIGSSIPLS